MSSYIASANGKANPSLVERYLKGSSTRAASTNCVRDCVDVLLRYHCVSDTAVQQAVHAIHARYTEAMLDPRSIAVDVGCSLSALDVAFKRQMGCTVTEYVRAIRLQRAGLLLATTGKTVKEVWVDVGYNHASNFNHDFKRRFHVSPRRFRAFSIRPLAQLHYESTLMTKFKEAAPPGATSVLIVDDDEATRTMLTTYLRAERSPH